MYFFEEAIFKKHFLNALIREIFQKVLFQETIFENIFLRKQL